MGPATPLDLEEFFFEADRTIARQEIGNYGAPVIELAKALVRSGNSVSIVTHRRGYGALTLDGPNLHFHRVPSERSRRQQVLSQWKAERRAMVRAALGLSPDVVHAHWTYEWALAAQATALPIVITVHDAPLTVLRYHRDIYRLIRLVMAARVRVGRGQHWLTAVSPYVAERWRRQMRDIGPVVVIPNITSDPIRSTSKSRCPTVIEIADDGPRKNVVGLLHVFKLVRESVPTARLVLVGPGLSEDGALAEDARVRGLSVGVQFLGVLSREAALDFLARSWVHAHLSHEESFGMTLLESLALNTAVIAGVNSGAAGWVLSSGRAGWLVDVNDTDSCADSIVNALISTEDRLVMVREGRNRFDEVFVPKLVVENYLDVYQQVIQSASNGRSWLDRFRVSRRKLTKRVKC